MNQKQLITIVVILVSSLTVMLAALFIVIKYDRTLLGLPSEKKLTHSKAKPDPLVSIPQSKLNWLEKRSNSFDDITKQKNSIYNEKLRLEDSLRKIDSSLKYLSGGKQPQGTKDASNTDKAGKLQDSLVKLTMEFLKTQKNLKMAEDRIKAQTKALEEKKDTNQTINYKQFAKIYNNSNPAEVAKILEKINERDAAMILKFMNQKKAGKVIEALSPKQAAAILLLGKTN